MRHVLHSQLRANFRKLFPALVVVINITTAMAQCRRAIPAECAQINKSKAQVYLSYIRVEKVDSKALGKSHQRLWLRLTNNTKCDLYVGTVPSNSSKSAKGNHIPSVRDGSVIEVIYLVDGKWGWGDALKSLILHSKSSLVFSIPLDKLKDASNIIVPINFEPLSSFSSTDVSQACFSLGQLPKNVLELIK